MDLESLQAYLPDRVSGFGTLLSAEKFAGGQSNPTFLLETTTARFVLRRKPSGDLLPSAHAVDREFRVLTALQDTDVPVPQTYHLCKDDAVIGSMFFVMEFLEGETYWDQTLPTLSSDERAVIFDKMNLVLTALHSIDVDAVGLGDYGRRGDYFARQLARWVKQYRSSETDTLREIERVIPWLEEKVPDDDGIVSLVHGDFRLDNMLVNRDSFEVIGLIDWELSTLGHPLADLAYQCAQWRLPPGKLSRGLAGVDRQSLGIPTEEEYVALYCKRRGLPDIGNWAFALTFSFFRLAAILQGVKKRAIDGNAASRQALEMGRMVRPLARMAEQVIEETG